MNRLSRMAAAALVRGTTSPTRLWLDIHSGNPEAGAGSAGIGRVGSDFTPAATSASNADLMEVGVTRNIVIDHFSLWDAEQGGRMWWVGEVTSRTYHPGDTFRVKPGNLVVGFIAEDVA